MDLDARPYRAFAKVAEFQSFRRAADALHITQPALSAQIRELERRLGFSLFVRTSRTVRLTTEGALFLDKVNRYILETEWLNQAARDIRNTKLRIGAAHFTGAVQERNAIIERFIRKYPDLPISVKGRSHASLMSDIARNEIDIAITLEPVEAAQSRIELRIVPDLERFVIADRPMRLISPRDGDFAGRAFLERPDLAGVDVAVINRSHGVALSEMIAHEFGTAGARLVHPPEGDAVSVGRYAALTGIAAVDLGWFDTPESMVTLELKGMTLATSLVVIVGSNNRNSAVSDFLSLMA